jgi:5'-nucleotidase
MQSRREFISRAAAGTAFLSLCGIPFDAFSAKEMVKIVVLHTNDVHSHIEPFADNDPKYPGLGGVAQRAAIINRIRNEEKNVLLLDAGDIFQGTPYFNLYGGEVEMKLMSQMGYDASAIGNHDFDNGVDGLSSQVKNASFPLLCANYDFSKTSMNGKTQDYKIFEKENIRIGVFGLGIELKGLVDQRMYKETLYIDPLQKAAEISHLLKKEKKCDLVICLSHLGYKYPDDKVSDEVLAKKSMNIDLVIGGHTHTFIDSPYKYFNRENKPVMVAQVGWAGIKLGRIDFYIEKKSGKIFAEGNTVKVLTKSS